jgi:hypothetical protein
MRMWRWIWLLWTLLLDGEGGTDDDTGEGAEDESKDDDQEDLRRLNPHSKIRALEAMLTRRKQREAKLRETISELEAKVGDVSDDPSDHVQELRTARLENSFLRTVMQRGDLGDTETAWDLLQIKGFMDAVKDDGEGMNEAIDKLLERYPYLVDYDSDNGDTGEEDRSLKKQRRVKPERQPQATTGTYESRFRALRGRR